MSCVWSGHIHLCIYYWINRIDQWTTLILYGQFGVQKSTTKSCGIIPNNVLFLNALTENACVWHMLKDNAICRQNMVVGFCTGTQYCRARKTAVTAYFSSHQLLPFAFALHHSTVRHIRQSGHQRGSLWVNDNWWIAVKWAVIAVASQVKPITGYSDLKARLLLLP